MVVFEDLGTFCSKYSDWAESLVPDGTDENIYFSVICTILDAVMDGKRSITFVIKNEETVETIIALFTASGFKVKYCPEKMMQILW